MPTTKKQDNDSKMVWINVLFNEVKPDTAITTLTLRKYSVSCNGILYYFLI